jgi:hypothetical protein
MFGAQDMMVDVVYHHHANSDSFPFRYGIHFNRTTSIEIFNCKYYKWQKNGEKFEVQADFIGKDDKIENGLFILAITDFPNPRVVTVMRNDLETEFYLSKLLRSLRESGEVSTNDFLDWHQLYLSGEANTFQKLAKLYAKKFNSINSEDKEFLISKANAEAKSEFENLLKDKENEIRRLKIENDKNIAATKEAIAIYEIAEKEVNEKTQLLNAATEVVRDRDGIIENQQREIQVKDSQINDYKNQLFNLAKQNPQYDGSEIEISTVGLLERVEKRKRTKNNGQIIDCVFLKFKGGIPERKMDEVFDPQDIIFEKAKQFIGEKVVTVTWRPEIFKATHWFRDIFLWEINNPPKAPKRNFKFFYKYRSENLSELPLFRKG